MRIVFCGTLVPEVYDTKLKYLSPAANRFQTEFCKELLHQGNELEILSYIGFPVEGEMPDFAKRNDFFEGRIEYIYKTEGVKSSIRLFKKRLVEKAQNADVIIAYNVVYAWISLPRITKHCKIKSALILADYTEMSSYQSLIRKLYARMQLYSIRRYALVVGLSANTKRFLKRGQKFYCMEGGISRAVYNFFSNPTSGQGKIKLMYSGLLEEVTGIDILLEAFHNVKSPNICLLVSGKGSMESLLKDYEKKDNRIENLGYMEYEEYLKMLCTADILINPRNMNLQENKNNFPSKIMEFLATGKMIISTKFSGYNKFEDVITFCESNAADMSRVIMDAVSGNRANMDEIYNRNRECAKRYLWDQQIGHISKLLKSL